jgi:guanosine-3',5'-bis(diphosphate) 3'-pyrophosphohydrolase
LICRPFLFPNLIPSENLSVLVVLRIKIAADPLSNNFNNRSFIITLKRARLQMSNAFFKLITIIVLDQITVMLELTERQWALFDFVKEMHGAQKRKYTGAPYYTHLLSVADRVDQYVRNGYETEIALCHDLIEDTACSLADLSSKLMSLGYNVDEDVEILAGVDDLTDKYTHDRFPSLNRAQRKELESVRIVSSRPVAQTVKYADIMDNISSVAEHDPGFARVYAREIDSYLWQIDKGNRELYAECCRLFSEIKARLKMDNEGIRS